MWRSPRSKRRSPNDGIPLDDESRPTECANCGAHREGTYCHECGQRYLKVRLNAPELWWIFTERFLDWEEGVWRTFLRMAVTPGTVIRHYLGGRRRTYLNPFSYLVVCVIVYSGGQFLLRRLAGISEVPGLDQVRRWSAAAFFNVDDESRLIIYGTVLTVALLAISMQLIFDTQLLNATEAVVTALYASGNVFILMLGVSVVDLIVTGHPLTFVELGIAFLSLFPLCMGHAGYGLFGGWTMVGYTAVAPVVASLIGGMFVLTLGGVVTSFVEEGVVVPVVLTSIVSVGPLFLLGLYLFDVL